MSRKDALPHFCAFEDEAIDYDLGEAASKGPYQYAPLSRPHAQFRLLRLCPDLSPVTVADGSGQPIQTTLQVCLTVHDLPIVRPLPITEHSYHALSYVWGDATILVPIVCDGAIKMITRNLYEALQRLWLWTFRPSHSDLSNVVGFGEALWIDALCINQDDLVEKSQQVRMMGEIYKKSSRVCVSLGSRVNMSMEACIAMLDRLNIEEALNFNPCPPRVDGTVHLVDLWTLSAANGNTLFAYLGWVMDALSANDYDDLAHLVTFCNLPYWTRAWVQQELVLSEHEIAIVMWGEWLWCWGSLYAAHRTLRLIRYLAVHAPYWPKWKEWKPEKLADLAKAAVALGRIVTNVMAPPMTLAEVIPLALCRRKQASLAVDYVYALLSMATDGASCGIVPDYRKGTVEVFQEVTEYLLEHLGARSLTYCEWCRSSVGQPSWVPDFTTYGKLNLAGLGERLYTAGGDRSNFKWQVEHKALHLRGWRTGVIDRLAVMPDLGKPTLEEDWRSTERWLRAFEQFVEEVAVSHSVNMMDAWRVPIADVADVNEVKVRAQSSMKEGYEELRNADLEGPTASGQAYASRSYRWQSGYKFFVTSGGLLGSSPGCVRLNDSVGVFAGADAPMILRASEGDTYRIVGEAYIQGLMDGEALSGDASIEDIVIV